MKGRFLLAAILALCVAVALLFLSPYGLFGLGLVLVGVCCLIWAHEDRAKEVG